MEIVTRNNKCVFVSMNFMVICVKLLKMNAIRRPAIAEANALSKMILSRVNV